MQSIVIEQLQQLLILLLLFNCICCCAPATTFQLMGYYQQGLSGGSLLLLPALCLCWLALPIVNCCAPPSLRLNLQAGRWVGYTLATICALASLLVILRTFKRVLLHQHFHKLQPKQQELMLHTLEHSGGAESRAFGRAISFMRDGSIIDMGLSRRVNSLPGTLRGMYGPDAKVSVGHHQNKRLQREETWTDYDAQIDAQEAAPAADTVAVANSSREAAAKEQGGLQEVYTQRASTEIMYTIQMLEVR